MSLPPEAPTVAVVLAWLILCLRLPGLLRHRHDPRLRYFCITLGVIAVGLTLLLMPFDRVLTRWLGSADVAAVAGDVVTVVGAVFGAWAGTALAAYLNHAENEARAVSRRFGRLAALTLVVIAVAVVFNPILPDGLSARARAGLPALPVARLISLLYVSLCAAYLSRLCWRFTKVSTRPSARLGFTLGMLSGLVAQAYVANELIGLLPMPIRPAGLGQAPDGLIVAEVTLFIVGMTLPSWAPRLGFDRLVTWTTECVALWRLYPLWQRLCAIAPEVVMVPPRPLLLDLLDMRDVRFRLYRRILEIRDVLLLHPSSNRLEEHGVAIHSSGLDLVQEARLTMLYCSRVGEEIVSPRRGPGPATARRG